MSTDLLLSILSYIFNSILLSSFIIPQVQRLKEIKDELVKFPITYVPNSGNVQEIRKSQEDQKKELKKFQNLLDIYALRSGELKDLVKYFRISIEVVVAAIIWSAIAEPQFINFILIVHTLVQISIFFMALRAYAVTPDRMQEIGYLVNDLDINPHELVNALDLRLSIDARGGLLAKNVKREAPLFISTFPQIRVLGFRFLLIIANENNKVFFVSFGPVSSREQIVRHLPPFGFTKEFNRIELGSFPFNLVKEKQELKMFFLIFLPFYKNDVYHPYLSEGRYCAEGIDSPSINISSSASSSAISTAVFYEGIEYKGVGVNIEATVKPNAKAHIINDVFRKYAEEFKSSKRINQYEDIDGGLI